MRDEILTALRSRGKINERRGVVEFCCPRHEDREPSAWMRDHAWGCFSCNFSEPLDSLADELGVPRETSGGYTVEQYAREKKFSLTRLAEWGVDTHQNGGRNCLVIPYLDQDGKLLRRRFRAGSKKWWEGKDLPIYLYGLHILGLHRDKKHRSVLFVEGESDCHTLWHYGMLALGVPGANAWRPEWAEFVGERDVYVWREPGAGGQQFVAAITRSFPKARVIVAPEGIKDPSELHIRSADEKAFKTAMRDLVQSALPADATPPPVVYDVMVGASLEALKLSKKEPISAVPLPLPTWASCCRGKGGRIGLAHGWHMVVGAAPGYGKSIMASNLAAHAIKFGERPTYISLEMDQEEVITRTLAIAANVPIGELESGAFFNEHTFDRATQYMNEQYEKTGGCIYVNRDPIYELPDILDSMSYNYEVNGSRFFLIDYLQLAWVSDARKIDQQITEVSHAVRRRAKDLRVACVGFSQFNRETTKNRKERPTYAGLMGGSPLENDAVQVALLDHSCYERGQRLDGSTYAKTFFLLDKNRHGPLEEIGIEIDHRTLRIRELLPDEALPQRKEGYSGDT